MQASFSTGAHRRPFAIQRAVLFALVLRELQTRFGKYRLGYAWAVLEPVGHTVVLSLIFSQLAGRMLAGIDFPVFLMTGVIPWMMFSDTVTTGMQAIESNRALFSYRQVKPLDTYLARALLEGVVHLVAYVLLVVAALWIGYRAGIADPLLVVAAVALLYLFGIGVGLVLCVAATLSPEVQKLVPWVLRPMYFLSGIFFSLHHVPDEFRPYLLWNPVLHAIELSRLGYFSDYYHGLGASWLYLGTAALVSLFFGLAVFRVFRLRLITA